VTSPDSLKDKEKHIEVNLLYILSLNYFDVTCELIHVHIWDVSDSEYLNEWKPNTQYTKLQNDFMKPRSQEEYLNDMNRAFGGTKIRKLSKLTQNQKQFNRKYSTYSNKSSIRKYSTTETDFKPYPLVAEQIK